MSFAAATDGMTGLGWAFNALSESESSSGGIGSESVTESYGTPEKVLPVSSAKPKGKMQSGKRDKSVAVMINFEHGCEKYDPSCVNCEKQRVFLVKKGHENQKQREKKFGASIPKVRRFEEEATSGLQSLDFEAFDANDRTSAASMAAGLSGARRRYEQDKKSKSGEKEAEALGRSKYRTLGFEKPYAATKLDIDIIPLLSAFGADKNECPVKQHLVKRMETIGVVIRQGNFTNPAGSSWFVVSTRQQNPPTTFSFSVTTMDEMNCILCGCSVCSLVRELMEERHHHH